MEIQDISITADDSGKRLDVFLTEKLDGFTRSGIQKLIEGGNISANGKTAGKSLKLNKNDIIKVILPEPKNLEVAAENIPLDIAYEDEFLLVVNKPKGMTVHPAAGNYEGTLVNALLHHCGGGLSGINGVIRPGIVHRIDKDTSGLLVVAKNDFAHKNLAGQLKEHTITREYRAVATGHLKEAAGTVDIPIGRSPKNRKKQAPHGINAREAMTHYEVLENLNGYDYIKCRLETGRTHQIRVHMTYLGHPLAGDFVYGGAKKDKDLENLHGQCLHAAMIGFVHPKTDEYMEFKSPLPDYFVNFSKFCDNNKMLTF